MDVLGKFGEQPRAADATTAVHITCTGIIWIFYHDDNDYDFFVFFMQDEKELCLATAQFEDFVLQFMDRWVTLFFKISSVIQYMYMQVPIGY